MADLALRPLSLGELLDRAFTVYRSRFGALLISTVACMAVPLLMVANNLSRFMAFAQASQTGASREETMKLAFAMMTKMFWIGLIALFAFVIARTALAWIAHKALLGDKADAFEGLDKGIRFLPQMLGLALIEGAIFMVVFFVLYIPSVIFLLGTTAAAGGSGGAGSVFGVLAVMAGTFSVILFLICSLFVTTSVLVAEADATVFKSLERSWTLTKGRKWQIFGGMVVVFALTFILQMGIAFGVSMFVGTAPDKAGPFMLTLFGLNALLNLLTTGYYYVFQMVVYYDLRVRKEGLDLELASEAMAPA